MRRDDGFTAFVGERWPRLVRSAVLLGCTPSEAEDVVQAALERCYVHWRQVDAADDVDAYVHRVLINTFRSTRRRRWTGERPVAQLPERAVDDADAVLRALARLNQDQRTAVVLRYYAHLGEQQMSEVLGVPPGTVKSRLARALAVLADDPHLADLRGAR